MQQLLVLGWLSDDLAARGKELKKFLGLFGFLVYLYSRRQAMNQRLKEVVERLMASGLTYEAALSLLSAFLEEHKVYLDYLKEQSH